MLNNMQQSACVCMLMSSTFTDKNISWYLIASSLLTAEGLIGGAHLRQSSINQMRECGASAEVTASGGFGPLECPFGILKWFWWGGLRSDGRWQLLLHLQGRVNKPFFLFVCFFGLWFVCGCSQPSPPCSIMSFVFPLFQFLHIFSISFLWKTEPTKHAGNTCTHLSAEPKKPQQKTLVHSLGNMDPEISESSPAVFSLAAQLRCRFRGYVIYAYADMWISQHSQQLSWAEFSCFGPRHCLLARWAVKSRTLCHRGPAAVWKRVRL